jgi:hypothetical protein
MALSLNSQHREVPAPGEQIIFKNIKFNFRPPARNLLNIALQGQRARLCPAAHPNAISGLKRIEKAMIGHYFWARIPTKRL